MVPAVVLLDRLPLTANGKLDRRGLPAPAAVTTSRIPGTLRERMLCDLVAETLGLPAAGPNDDFFRLGGDSVDAIRLAARAYAAGLAIEPTDLLRGGTIARLAALAGDAPEPGRLSAPTAEILPLTPLQEGLLYHAHARRSRRDEPDHDRDEPDHYVVQLVHDLAGPLDRDVLRASASAVLGRHPNLAARFDDDGGTPVQVVPSRPALAWRQVDAGEAGVDRLLAAELARPMDPATGPLLRFALLAAGPARHRLALTAHHLVLDGWSAAVLVDELLETYRHGGDPTTLPPAPPYATHLRWLADRDRAAARDVWRRALAGVTG